MKNISVSWQNGNLLPPPCGEGRGGGSLRLLAAPRNKKQFVAAKKLRQNLSPIEQKLWLRLRAEQLGVKFRRQQPLLDYIVDFCCLSLRLIIEIDGDTHAETTIADRMRDQKLTSAGYLVLRYINQQIVHELDNVIEDICRHIALMAANPLPNPPRKGEGNM